MVAPPFNVQETLPGDNDIVSQHPPNARAFRDTIESWILWNHNTQGRHDELDIDHHADAGYPGIASVTQVWASSDDIGDLHKRHGTGSIEWVGMPPGTVTARFDSNVPNGHVACNGAAISRTVAGVRLFALYGVTYGVGDGATTFNLPTCTGKVLVGVDAGSTNISGFTTIGVTAGAKTFTIAQANLPNVAFTVSGIALNDPGHFHDLRAEDSTANATFVAVREFISPANAGLVDVSPGTKVSTTGITVSSQGTAASGGSGTALALAQVGIAVQYVIKL